MKTIECRDTNENVGKPEGSGHSFWHQRALKAAKGLGDRADTPALQGDSLGVKMKPRV